MFAKVRDWIGVVFGKVRGCLGLLIAVVTLALCPGSLFAQTTPLEIPVPEIPLNWTALPETVVKVLASPVVVAIGIAIAIWVVLKAMALFKRTA